MLSKNYDSKQSVEWNWNKIETVSKVRKTLFFYRLAFTISNLTDSKDKK